MDRSIPETKTTAAPLGSPNPTRPCKYANPGRALVGNTPVVHSNSSNGDGRMYLQGCPQTATVAASGASPGIGDVLLRGAHRAVFEDRLDKSGSLELNGRDLFNGLAIFVGCGHGAA